MRLEEVCRGNQNDWPKCFRCVLPLSGFSFNRPRGVYVCVYVCILCMTFHLFRSFEQRLTDDVAAGKQWQRSEGIVRRQTEASLSMTKLCLKRFYVGLFFFFIPFNHLRSPVRIVPLLQLTFPHRHWRRRLALPFAIATHGPRWRRWRQLGRLSRAPKSSHRTPWTGPAGQASGRAPRSSPGLAVPAHRPPRTCWCQRSARSCPLRDISPRSHWERKWKGRLKKIRKNLHTNIIQFAFDEWRGFGVWQTPGVQQQNMVSCCRLLIELCRYKVCLIDFKRCSVFCFLPTVGNCRWKLFLDVNGKFIWLCFFSVCVCSLYRIRTSVLLILNASVDWLELFQGVCFWMESLIDVYGIEGR